MLKKLDLLHDSERIGRATTIGAGFRMIRLDQNKQHLQRLHLHGLTKKLLPPIALLAVNCSEP